MLSAPPCRSRSHARLPLSCMLPHPSAVRECCLLVLNSVTFPPHCIRKSLRILLHYCWVYRCSLTCSPDSSSSLSPSPTGGSLPIVVVSSLCPLRLGPPPLSSLSWQHAKNSMSATPRVRDAAHPILCGIDEDGARRRMVCAPPPPAPTPAILGGSRLVCARAALAGDTTNKPAALGGDTTLVAAPNRSPWQHSLSRQQVIRSMAVRDSHQGHVALI